MRIQGHLPLVERDVQGGPVERCEIRPCVVHKDVQRAELTLHPVEHAADILRTRHVALDDETIGPVLPYLRKGIVRGLLMFVIVNGYIDAVLCQFQSDASANTTRAPGNERKFSLK